MSMTPAERAQWDQSLAGSRDVLKRLTDATRVQLVTHDSEFACRALVLALQTLDSDTVHGLAMVAVLELAKETTK